jgi:hypothetical protein
VAAHDLPLVDGQRGGLEEDLFGNHELADVVEECRTSERGALCIREAEPGGEVERDEAHAARVSGRVRLARVDLCGKLLEVRPAFAGTLHERQAKLRIMVSPGRAQMGRRV